MKAGIHPDYKTVTVHCACGASWTTRSTKGPELRLEICSSCHPFFTGKQKLIDSAGRVERYTRKYAGRPAAGEHKQPKRPPAPPKAAAPVPKKEKAAKEKPAKKAEAAKTQDTAE